MSPGDISGNNANICAECPDDEQTAPIPPSKVAILSCSTDTVGLDNLEYISNEKILYSLFNFAEQYNKYLIINSIEPINSIEFSLVDLKSRLKNCIYAKIDKPDDDMIFALVLKHLSDRQIKIEKKIIRQRKICPS